MINSKQKSRRRSPKEFSNDPDQAFKSTITVAVARTTLVAAMDKAQRLGSTVSAVVREALEQDLRGSKPTP